MTAPKTQALPPGSLRAVVLDSPSVEFCGTPGFDLYNYTDRSIRGAWGQALRNTKGTAPWLILTTTSDMLMPAAAGLFRKVKPGAGDVIYAEFHSHHAENLPPGYEDTIWPVWMWYGWEGWRGHCLAG